MPDFWSLIYTLAVLGFIAWIWLENRSRGSSIQEIPKNLPGATKQRTKKDDLTKIKGIGLVIAKRLNQLGYHRFDQIAGWKRADIKAVTEQLSFKGRIERDRWVEQARALHRVENKTKNKLKK